ncbi:MAG TPA: hypothetical protein VE978_18210 [Chitinophagales bacterium]|nr:hypothetical protein [Chitinophagales bacterium]
MNSRDEIEDELKEMTPYLSSLQKSHPFKVPSTYFEEMEVKLISSINKQGKDEETIFSFPEEHPFNVPGYRDEELHEKEIRATSAITKKISDYKLWLAAASVAVVAVASTTLFFKDHSIEITPGTVTTESVASDLMYASEVDEAMVVELYLQDQQQTTEQNNSSDNANDENNFLRDVTDIDPNLIYEM